MNETKSVAMSRMARAGLVCGSIAAVMLIAAPLGFRAGLWDYPFALRKLTVLATFIAVAGLIPALIGLWSTRNHELRGRNVAIVGLALVLPVIGMNLAAFKQVKSVPFIHDITTDTHWPPGFVNLSDVRNQDGLNGANYAGEEIAKLQQQGYPDLQPLTLAQPPSAVFAAAVSVVNDYGWDIAGLDRLDGRIEATDTSFWYAFKDDIVIRITPEGNGTRVDVRSASRVGQSDLGANAARIRCFMDSLATKLGQ